LIKKALFIIKNYVILATIVLPFCATKHSRTAKENVVALCLRILAVYVMVLATLATPMALIRYVLTLSQSAIARAFVMDLHRKTSVRCVMAMDKVVFLVESTAKALVTALKLKIPVVCATVTAVHA
jgi:hypothetical protein